MWQHVAALIYIAFACDKFNHYIHSETHPNSFRYWDSEPITGKRICYFLKFSELKIFYISLVTNIFRLKYQFLYFTARLSRQ